MLAVLAMAAVENHLRDGINCNSFAWFESNPAWRALSKAFFGYAGARKHNPGECRDCVL